MHSQITPPLPQAPKKVYDSPVLHVYGGLADITAAASTGTHKDNAQSGNSKQTV